jgi:hypothetical protein
MSIEMGGTRVHQPWLKIMRFGAVVAVTLMMACGGAAEDPRQTSSAPTDRAAGPASIPPDQLCPKEVTVDQGAEAIGVPVLLPNDTLAEGSGLGALLCPGPELLIQYSSGITISESKNTLADPDAEWKGLADDYPEFSLGSTQGVAASLADPAKGAIGGVQFVLGNGRYMVIGNSEIPLDDLIRVSNSLAAAEAS